ncbi:hypothetical protein HMPREF3221_00921, partial [Fusobacterium nucleatum]
EPRDFSRERFRASSKEKIREEVEKIVENLKKKFLDENIKISEN